jgi:3-dehydroquinate synthase
MTTVSVELGARAYPILIGAGLLKDAATLAQHVPARDVLLVSNTVVSPLYASAITQALPGRRLVEVVLPDGEAHKTLATVARIVDVLVTNRFGRDCMLIALGGGVVGDVAGFAAACYQRGVAYVQLPTTLDGQVDASVGGMTGVTHPGG